jgi:hydrogenase maturation protease
MPPEAPGSSRAPRESDPVRPREGPEEGQSGTGQRDPRFARVVIGVGNPLRGDDGAGRAVARILAALGVPGLAVRESSGEATSLMDAWAGFDDVGLVDACRGAGPPGSLHVFSADEVDRVASLRHASSHSLGVAAAIGLARALGTLPGRLVVYAIEARDTAQGDRLSAQVEDAVRGLADRLARSR